jgi:hypothetical protein
MSGLSDSRLLIASHIVPWSSDKANRLNPSFSEEDFYQGISDQPDCCGYCGARLDHIETVEIDSELVYVCP